MKSALMFVLFLSLMIITCSRKTRSLEKRINRIFDMFTFNDMSENYAPSDYAANLLNKDLDVTSLSIKIQLCREFVQAVLDYIKFPSEVIGNVNTVKVSQLMDSMDLFVSIAMGKKNGTDLSGLTTIYDFLPADDMTSNLAVTANVNDAVSFIKDTINPDSVINISSRVKGKSREDKVKKEERSEKKADKAVESSNDDSDSDSEEEDDKDLVHPNENHSKVSKKSKRHLKTKASAKKKPIIEVKDIDHDEEDDENENENEENDNESTSVSNEEEDEDESEEEEEEKQPSKRSSKSKKSRKSEVAKKRKSPSSKKVHKTVRIIEEDDNEEDNSTNHDEKDSNEDEE